MNRYDEYLVEYPYNGEQWSLHVKAESFEDACQRVQHAAKYGEVLGRVVVTASLWRLIVFVAVVVAVVALLRCGI